MDIERQTKPRQAPAEHPQLLKNTTVKGACLDFVRASKDSGHRTVDHVRGADFQISIVIGRETKHQSKPALQMFAATQSTVSRFRRLGKMTSVGIRATPREDCIRTKTSKSIGLILLGKKAIALIARPLPLAFHFAISNLQ